MAENQENKESLINGKHGPASIDEATQREIQQDDEKQREIARKQDKPARQNDRGSCSTEQTADKERKGQK